MIIKIDKFPLMTNQLPYKSWWIATVDDETYIFIQISPEQDKPQWTKLNNLIETMPHLIVESLEELVYEAEYNNHY